MTAPEPPGVRLARAAVRPHGTIVELGTSAGVGLAWIVHGIGARTDLVVHTVDIDAAMLAATSTAGWPSFVHFVEGDGARLVSELAIATKREPV